MRSVQKLMDLSERVALILGGAGHLGSAMAEALAEAGSDLVILDVNEQNAHDAARDLSDRFGIAAVPVVADLADEAALRALPQTIEDQFGRLDILIYVAALIGTSPLKGWAVPFDKQNADTWRLALEINLTAAFIATQACMPLLKASGHGSIINVSSHYGLVGPDMDLYEGTQLGNPAAYAASKAGLIQFTRWLSTSLAPEIRANCISPGGIWRKQPDVFHQKYIRKTPLQRMATEEDFKGATVYLASDLSAYCTGQNLVIDGGFTAW